MAWVTVGALEALGDIAAADLVTGATQTRAAVDARVSTTVPPLVAQAMADDGTVRDALLAGISGAVADMNLLEATHGVEIEPIDLDTLRAPADIGYRSARAEVLANLPADLDVSGNPIVGISVERNAANAVVQRVTTRYGSWWRAAINNQNMDEWHRIATAEDVATVHPVVSADPYASIDEGQTLYVIDPAHAAHDFPVGTPDGFSVPWASSGASFLRNADENVLDGTGTRYSGTGAGLLRWDQWTPFTDGDVLVRMAYVTDPANQSAGVLLRSDGTATNRNGYFCFVTSLNGVPTLAIASFVNNNYTRIGSTQFDIEAGEPFMMRAHAEGSEISVKAWHAGTPEPGGWMVTVSDSEITAGGVGFMQAGGSRGVMNYLAVNTGGVA